MKLTKVLNMILLMLCCFFLETCSFDKKVQSPIYKIGFSQCTDDMWRQIMMIQMEAEATKYPEIKLIIKDAENNSNKQITQIKEFIDEKVDLLIISPNESEPITEVAVKAYQSGIPTIIWDRKINSEKYTTFISADNYDIGRNVGRYISSILPKGSTILEIYGLRGSSPANERHQGFIDVVNNDYYIHQITGNWQAVVTKARVEDIGYYKNIDLVFGHNDDMTIAAYDAIASFDTLDAQRIKFIGVDAIVGVDAVIDGRLEASFLYPPGGELVIETAIKILRGEKVDKTHTLKSAIVDKTNAETIKSQSELILNYQSHINSQRKELDSMSGSYFALKGSIIIFVVVLVLLLMISSYTFIINRKVLKKNRHLETYNREVEFKTSELILKNNQIENITDQKLHFFTNISHEIRTPLTLILNPLDKISRNEKDPSIRRDIWTIQRNAKHLLKMVNQLLDFRKIENNKMTLSVSEVDIIPFSNEILKYFETYAESEKIIYKFFSNIESQKLWIDTDKIETVLLNLISNSFKNSKKYGIIIVSIVDNINSIIIEVNDTGRGMDIEAQQHVFDRFYSLNNSSSSGMGIGLHLTKEYIEMHQGKISVNSQSNEFTSFYVELFKGKEHLPEETIFIDTLVNSESIVTEADIGEAAKEQLSKHYNDTILIVEDDDDIRDFLQKELSENFNVVAVNDGLEATEYVFKNNLSLVLSDVLMPKINGFQLCHNIKTNVSTSHIPVILLTALAEDNQRIYGIAEGADEYIRKPFNIVYLKIKIIRIIEERRQLLESFIRQYNAAKFTDVNVKDIPCADDIFRDKLFELMESSYEDSDFSVEQMSDSLGISRIHLYRKIKSLFGLTPTDLQRDFRLSKALKIIQQQKFTVSEVAYMVGFTSPAYFSKCFKEKNDCTPREYIKKHCCPIKAL
jgi:signal transduction histidine kinase/CheY-like chemotaxis protein